MACCRPCCGRKLSLLGSRWPGGPSSHNKKRHIIIPSTNLLRMLSLAAVVTVGLLLFLTSTSSYSYCCHAFHHHPSPAATHRSLSAQQHHSSRTAPSTLLYSNNYSAASPAPGARLLQLRPAQSIIHQNRSPLDGGGYHYDTRRTKCLLLQSRREFWEGDDRRWWSKWRRQLRRNVDLTNCPARNALTMLNAMMFTYQMTNTIQWIQFKYPNVWPSQAGLILFDTIMGSSRPGPLTVDFMHSVALSPLQPYRFLTAGFLHGSLLHLILNLDALRRLPDWLETGLGTPLYLTTFLASIVTGNVAFNFMEGGAASSAAAATCLGASGGICGLYGLLYVTLVRMGNHAAAGRVMKGMGMLVLYGLFLSRVSNAGHVGGFLGGIIVAILCGPSYRKSYALRRKNSLQVDRYDREYRQAMGYDKIQAPRRSRLPLALLWAAVLVALSSQARYRAIPRLVWQGLSNPGSLTARMVRVS